MGCPASYTQRISDRYFNSCLSHLKLAYQQCRLCIPGAFLYTVPILSSSYTKTEEAKRKTHETAKYRGDVWFWIIKEEP
jgi:hypothetical protein